jgi:hypothetical protein
MSCGEGRGKIVVSGHTISQSIGSIGVSPVQAQAEACGYHKLRFDCNSVSVVRKIFD